MIFEDWRDLASHELDPLYEQECARYRTTLGWDYESSCRIIEDARRAGRLPGIVLRGPGGDIRGWSYFVVHEGVLQIGGLVADTAAHLRRMLDRVLQSPEAAYARALTTFVLPVSSSLQAAFERQRFTVARHPYLARPTTLSAPERDRRPLAPDLRLRMLSEVDPADVVRLTARAYAGLAEAKCFAPDGRLEQWAHYLGQLLATPACGQFLSEASFAVELRGGHGLAGAVITTALAPETAHIAQIVVDPRHRRSGLAVELVASAVEASARRGHPMLTLIVAESNAPARSLYERVGFSETASFLFAGRAAPSRRALPPDTSSRVPAQIERRSAR